MTRSAGTSVTRFNALRHGILSRHALLPWEDAAEYADLLAALAAEHAPVGPTEEHLVEELAGIIWRKRRVRMAEAAAHGLGLHDAAKPFRDTASAALAHLSGVKPSVAVAEAVDADAETSSAELKALETERLAVERALETASSDVEETYEAAVAALGEGVASAWADALAVDPNDLEVDDTALTPTSGDLVDFLDQKALPGLERRRAEIEARPRVRDQALGQSLDPNRLDRLARYETHLDRKLERMLAMLIRLKDLRAADSAD